ncbi:MAG: D-inositol-3-phosphate glycosyltransferase [Ignavibacteria bacterium]|nr:D-inositol-3-phosphate glycosyltransferase [Ignavibacteria bacterium]
MKLVIISHTSHYISKEKIVGWGPTVREINKLSDLFDVVYHIAPFYKKNAPDSSLPYSNEKIIYTPINSYGGENIKDKLTVITTAPHNLNVIRNTIKKLDRSDWIHFRAPTAMGLYVIPYLSINRIPKLWVKYAGNWRMENQPLSYSFQKWWLANNLQRSKVTINGYWKGQKEHLLDFKNPCFDKHELDNANRSGMNKNFSEKLTICFAGSLTQNKGAGILIDALREFTQKDQIEEVIIAGDGILRSEFEKSAEQTGVKITFKGYLSKDKMYGMYESSHLIVLPSESEGFPKVIAEAAACGCVPIVSDVSSVSQSFDEDKAFLLKRINAEELTEKLISAFEDRNLLKKKSEACIKISEEFTYENYIKAVKEKILSD